MKTTFKIGDVTVATTTTFPEGAQNKVEEVVLRDLEISTEISAEEMKQQMSNIKELFAGLKEIYIFTKEELNNGSINKIKDNIKSL